MVTPSQKRRQDLARQPTNKSIVHAACSLGLRFAHGPFWYVDQESWWTEILKRRVEMKGFRIFTLAGALMLFAVTAAFGMSTKSDYEKNFDFSQLRTFAFKTDRASNDPLSTNTLEARRIQNALAAQLEANGFSQASQNQDFIVAFYSRTKQKTQVQSAGGFGPGFGR